MTAVKGASQGIIERLNIQFVFPIGFQVFHTILILPCQGGSRNDVGHHFLSKGLTTAPSRPFAMAILIKVWFKKGL